MRLCGFVNVVKCISREIDGAMDRVDGVAIGRTVSDGMLVRVVNACWMMVVCGYGGWDEWLVVMN